MIIVNSIRIIDKPAYITDDKGNIIQNKPEYYLISKRKIDKSLNYCSDTAVINQDAILFVIRTIVQISMKYITVQDLNTTLYLYPIVDILDKIDDMILSREASNISEEPINRTEFDFNDIMTFNISYINLGSTGIYCIESVEEIFNKKLS